MNWKKIWAIIKREYIEHIRRKAFWIFTVLMPMIWIGFLGISILTQSKMTTRKRVAVVDVTGRYFSALQAEVETQKPDNRPELVLRRPGAAGVDALKEELTHDVNEKEDRRKIDAFVILDDGAIRSGTLEYWAPSISDILFQENLQHDINKAIMRARLQAHGVSPEVIQQSQETISLKPRSTQSTVGFWISYIFMFFLFFTLIQYGMYNLRGVIEEKSNRIVEIIISSVRPIELMIGKIVGIGLVGLTQYAIWSVLAMNMAPLAAGTGLTASLPEGKLPAVPMLVIIAFVVYFVLGYFFYAGVYTALGAPFNSDQEAQQLAMFPTFIMAIPMFFWFIIVNDPNGTLATVLSFIPFTTPVVMFMRVTLAPVAAWQIAVSVLVMVVSTLAVAWFAGKIYRVGILMYGKKPTVPEIFRWLRRPGPGAAKPAAGETQA
jgi:ABC-2 type transport system permease protein